MQNRRHFVFNDDFIKKNKPNFFNLIDFDEFTDDYQYKINLTDYSISKKIQGFDGIVSVSKNNITVHQYVERHHNVTSVFFWNLCGDLIKEFWPEYYSSYLEYDRGNIFVWSNCFVLRKKLFDQLCKFEFDLLQRIHNFAQQNGYYDDATPEELRIPAYCSEKILGIYYVYLLNNGYKINTSPLSYIKQPHKYRRNFIQYSINSVLNDKLLVYITDNNYLKNIDVSLRSVIFSCNKNIKLNVLIIHDGSVTDELVYRFVSSYSTNKFVSIDFISAKPLYKKFNIDTYFYKRLNTTVYLKLFIPLLVKGYKKCLYLDGDIMVRGDIDDLFNLNLGDRSIAAVKDACLTELKDSFWKDCRNYYIKHNLLEEPLNYFNSGVLIFNLEKIRHNNTVISDLIAVAKLKFNDRKFHDQDCFNVVFQNDVMYLENKYNYQLNFSYLCNVKKIPVSAKTKNNYFLSRNLNQIILLHFDGDIKPWNTINSTNEPFIDEWWKTALQSPFYNELLLKMFRKKIPSKQNLITIKTSHLLKFLVKFVTYRILYILSPSKIKSKLTRKLNKYLNIIISE